MARAQAGGTGKGGSGSNQHVGGAGSRGTAAWAAKYGKGASYNKKRQANSAMIGETSLKRKPAKKRGK